MLFKARWLLAGPAKLSGFRRDKIKQRKDMHWHRTISDLPFDSEEVLVRWDGIVSLATFSEKNREFITNTIVRSSTAGLQWLKIGTSEEETPEADTSQNHFSENP
jgi:hypothetical protein